MPDMHNRIPFLQTNQVYQKQKILARYFLKIPKWNTTEPPDALYLIFYITFRQLHHVR